MIFRRNRVFGFGAAPDGLSHGLIELVSSLLVIASYMQMFSLLGHVCS